MNRMSQLNRTKRGTSTQIALVKKIGIALVKKIGLKVIYKERIQNYEQLNQTNILYIVKIYGEHNQISKYAILT